MRSVSDALVREWSAISPRLLPIREAGAQLTLGRLLRLALFQVSVGMAVVLVVGTLNRVMIVELGVPAWLVAAMVALPLVFAPLRAAIGFRSDTHRSVLGWRRVPYLWIGTLLLFGGLAIMPFALLVLSSQAPGAPPPAAGEVGAALAFLLVGAGLHTTQTVGLALATDLAPPEAHPRVVTILCVMLLAGMVASAVLFGMLLTPFSPVRLIQVIQGAAAAAMVLNLVALWKQEARDPSRTAQDRPRPRFADAWRALNRDGRSTRRLVAVALGTVAFSMQDVLLEPYGGQILHLPVGSTTKLTALLAVGGIAGFTLAACRLGRGADPHRLAALGALAGLVAFAAVIFAAPLASEALFAGGTAGIGFGASLFEVGTLTAAMRGAQGSQSTGLFLGTWGAVQAFAAGTAIALGGGLRDAVSSLAERGALGAGLADPATGYVTVYHAEIALLFATLVAIGPLVGTASGNFAARNAGPVPVRPATRLGLAGPTQPLSS